MSENVIDISFGDNEEKEKFELKIDDRVFTIFLSNPRVTVYQSLNENNDVDYKLILLKWIYNGISDEQKPLIAIEQIDNQPDEFFANIFNRFLQKNEKWNYFYNEISENDFKIRFILSFVRYEREELSLTIKNFNPLKNAADSISTMTSSLTKSTANLLSVPDPLAELRESLKSLTSVAVNSLRDLYQPTTALDSLRDSLNSITSIATNALKNITIPTISEERKKELIESYKKWGNYGWTPHPKSSISFYNTCPNNYIEADRYAIKVCNKQNTQFLFGCLREQHLPKRDLEEAIICFEHKHYKACSMLLYSIIDGKIIRLQKRLNKENLKTCGEKAIEYFKKAFEKKTNVNDTVFFLLDYTCTCHCLSTYFESAQNFELITNVANRNLVDHGMAKKQVRKKDCQKLFLLLYNFEDLLEELYSEDK